VSAPPRAHVVSFLSVAILGFLSLRAPLTSIWSRDIDGTAPFNDSIQQADLKADLFFLASDAMKGRLTTTPENQLAGEFIQSRFERLGLKPAGPNGSYYQPFDLVSASLGEENLLEVVKGKSSTAPIQSGEDYYPLSFSASGTAQGPLVFAGFGISAPELSYDDYHGNNIEGKIVMVLDHEPGEKSPTSPFDGVVSSEYSQPIQKALTAQGRGAVAIVFVRDVHNHPQPYDFAATASRYWPDRSQGQTGFLLASQVERVRIPAVRISPALAQTLLLGPGRKLQALSQAAETRIGMPPLQVPGVEVALSTSVNRHTTSDRNVVAFVEGSDESVKDEWVIVCAHYDHEGVDKDGQVYNGADDNGSGTVALIEIAEAYAQAAREGLRPRRSVLFAAWNSEESGLLGAWAYTEQQLAPLPKTVAVLNMDMIGRNQTVAPNGGYAYGDLEPQTSESNRNTVHIVGPTFSHDLMAELEKANRAFGLELKTGFDNDPSNVVRRSDQWPFLQRDVPALMITTGSHPDYHTVNDTPEKINYEKMERIARMVHQLSWNLAQDEGRPKIASR
jgi:hypothetical protein